MRSTTILNLIGLILLTIFLMSCAPSPVYRVTSLEDLTEYIDGEEFTTKEDDQAASSIEFEDYTNDNLVFYIQMANKSDSLLTIHPEYITIETLNSEMLSYFNPRIAYAIDPNEQIDMLNSEIKNRDNWHDAATGLNILFGLVSIIADVADDDDRNDAYEVAEDIAVVAGNQINEEIDYDIDMNDLNSEKEFWKNGVLRITTLDKEEQIGGLVFLPFNPNARFIKIEIPIGNSKHSYLYKQFRIN
ncbi:hypothetical protein ACFLTH_12190 [Bacteroidota bacterium]